MEVYGAVFKTRFKEDINEEQTAIRDNNSEILVEKQQHNISAKTLVSRVKGDDKTNR